MEKPKDVAVEREPARDCALVTGASSGIGAEIARALAARKIDLAISARRIERLDALKAELEAAHRVRVTTFAVDLDSPDGADQLYDEVRQSGIAVSMLVNNAGFGYYGEVAKQSPEKIASMVQVNVGAVTTLSRRFGQEMAARKRGFILNIASYAALQPIPRYSVYSGAKAYVVAFSLGLRHELARRGVRVSVACPGFTATEFHQVAEHEMTAWMRWTTLDPRRVARACVSGMLAGKGLIVPGLFYRSALFAGRFAPRSWGVAISAAVVKS
jgi:hypothetical protein